MSLVGTRRPLGPVALPRSKEKGEEVGSFLYERCSYVGGVDVKPSGYAGKKWHKESGREQKSRLYTGKPPWGARTARSHFKPPIKKP